MLIISSSCCSITQTLPSCAAPSGRGSGLGQIPTSDDSYPSINDNSMRTSTKKDVQERFIGEQIEEKIHTGRMSPTFGTDLFPGVYSVPIHT
ncbi:hypothetical protein K503DRAFT_337574 [Rhizopogon vinicolor AM-OR11-026]|uniref:Uncharacterized protein n=1 Tax=Rhizopogon vinicolor AM-OR11-026 TaxID=1314800 RepID=A0A1B7MTL9_9AGAM|nr:hypothetical protein K503DRAFT_337574 [Rhizopogon vinicolor AM-OR11-026]